MPWCTMLDRRTLLQLSAVPLCLPALARAGTASAIDFNWLDSRLSDRVAKGYFNGMGLVIGSGERILHEAYFGDGGPDKVLHVASSGKWTAVAAIAALVDEGKLSWEDPVRKFLPEFKDIKGTAKLRQLLSHTAGYPDYQPEGARRDDYQTLIESVSHIVDLPAVSEPGQIFQYGGLAMQVAGRMAERAAGQDFDEIFQSRIARPLGMSRSGYAPVSGEPGFSPMLGGSLFTSAPDYARFLMMISRDGLYQGRRVLSASVINHMQADQVQRASVKPYEFVEAARADKRKDVYGLGEWREEVDEKGRATLISSPGWAGAYSWLDRRYDVWGFVLAKANVETAVADGYNTFLGSSIYAPMLRRAIDDTRARDIRTGKAGPLYYEESGRGSPVIFVHGHSFDRTQWAPQIAALEQSHRIIRYDLRGYGRSDMPAEADTTLHADDLLGLMNRLNIKRAHLVGLSLGGFVVTDFLALHSDRVDTATLAGGDIFDVPGPDEPWTPTQIATRRQQIAGLKKEGLTAFKRRWFEELIDHSGSRKDKLRAPLWKMIDEWQAWQPLHVEPRYLLGHSVIKHLKQNQPSIRVLVIRGDKETAGFKILELLPQSKLKILADCGHVSNLESPHDFTSALRGFWRNQ